MAGRGHGDAVGCPGSPPDSGVRPGALPFGDAGRWQPRGRGEPCTPAQPWAPFVCLSGDAIRGAGRSDRAEERRPRPFVPAPTQHQERLRRPRGSVRPGPCNPRHGAGGSHSPSGLTEAGRGGAGCLRAWCPARAVPASETVFPRCVLPGGGSRSSGGPSYQG